jgi:hypothetical protein
MAAEGMSEGGGQRFPQALIIGAPPRRAPLIWISSGLRGRAAQLRKNRPFGGLEMFGIPWILSSEMRDFNGLRATLGQKKFAFSPFSCELPTAVLERVETAVASSVAHVLEHTNISAFPQENARAPSPSPAARSDPASLRASIGSGGGRVIRRRPAIGEAPGAAA